MPEEVFAQHLLCPLLMLSEDKVPNVRITVADTVSTYVLKSGMYTTALSAQRKCTTKVHNESAQRRESMHKLKLSE